MEQCREQARLNFTGCRVPASQELRTIKMKRRMRNHLKKQKESVEYRKKMAERRKRKAGILDREYSFLHKKSKVTPGSEHMKAKTKHFTVLVYFLC